MKPSIPKGTRDFSPLEVTRRNYIFSAIRTVFERYGFQPIETPVMEKLSTLTGKYGEEGDRLLFKVLNSGDFLKKATELNNSQKLTPQISEKGLRYDLTVPFARYVVMHQNEITFPFRRYQIQPVWRADRPQKGRYREFFQCDADVIGTESLFTEAELLQIFDEVFTQFGIRVTIRLNNRKVLQGLAEVVGAPDKMMEITIALDKIDKIGWEGVAKELAERGLSETVITNVREFVDQVGTEGFALSEIEAFFAESEAGQKGIAELQQVTDLLEGINFQNEIRFDLTLARGLDYYTGCIFEVEAKDFKMGSISSGGRYDDLTGIFGLKNMSGVGISFGADRIYDVMEGLNLFPEGTATSTQVLIVGFDDKARTYGFPILRKLREAGISAELYPDQTKLKKQLDYANKKNIPFVILIGDDEMAAGKLAFKNMETGEQERLSLEEILERF
ncbi:MAG: histidine--tRNA ligase [Bacteroidota bacterium]